MKIRHVKTNKIDANGGNVRFSVCIICKSQQQTRFSNTRITNKKQFKKIITEIFDVNKL